MEPTFGEGHESSGPWARSADALHAGGSERAARFQKSLCELQIEGSPDGVIVVSPSRRILLSNRRFREIWQLPEQVMTSDSDREAIAAARDRLRDPDEFVARVDWLYAHPEAEAHDELELVDGRVLERFTAPVRDRELGTCYGRLWSFRDISNRKLLAAERAAKAARDEFLSIASHELRSPVAGLQLAIDSLGRALIAGRLPELPPMVADLVRTSGNHVRRIATLVDTLLDVTKIRSGKLYLVLEEVDLRAVADEVVGRFCAETGRTGCDVTLVGETPVIGRWDRARVEQIVDNLVSNAVKYGARKPVTVTVSLDGDSTARLVVADRGIGIPADRIGSIFDRFERAVSARAYEGLGLGLYIVGQIVAHLGGRIRVESTPGIGSTFTVELPISGPAKPTASA